MRDNIHITKIDCRSPIYWIGLRRIKHKILDVTIVCLVRDANYVIVLINSHLFIFYGEVVLDLATRATHTTFTYRLLRYRLHIRINELSPDKCRFFIV